MMQFLLATITGWIAVLAVGIEAALPFIFRNSSRSTSLIATPRASSGGLAARPSNFLNRMWPHYWLGYALLVLVLAHTSFVMGPIMGRTDAIGIWAATLALCLLFVQVGLGLVLQGTPPNRRQLRRCHFWSMIGFIGLVLIHLARNG